MTSTVVTPNTLLCFLCGIAIEPNPTYMCRPCLATQVDVTDCINKSSTLTQCKTCLRFQRGTGWVDCELESAELMALCLKNIHGLAKCKLVDANFIWTEPHSKRIKVKITIQKEALNKAMIQQTCVVEFVVENLKCSECSKKYHNNMWRAKVQIRQKVEHKRTFFRLEQMIIDRDAHSNCIGIESNKDGMDFYFAEKNAAEKFKAFVCSSIPAKAKASTKLISSDNHNNTANVRLTIGIDLVPICKDDLLYLPKKVAQHARSIPRLVLMSKIASQLKMIHPFSGQKADLTAEKYWRTPFKALLTSQNLVDFIVLDVEPLNHAHDSTAPTGVLAEAEVARETDFGVNDTTFFVRTHLGAFLKAGDTVKGYDLSTCNFGEHWQFEEELPDVVLVRREYSRNKLRKLKTLQKKDTRKLRKADVEREQQEFDAFVAEFSAELNIKENGPVEKEDNETQAS